MSAPRHSNRPGGSGPCGQHRPRRSTGPDSGRLPCVLDAGHDGPHGDVFQRTWAKTEAPRAPRTEATREARRQHVAPEVPPECGERALDPSGFSRVCVKDSGHDGDHADARADTWERPEHTLGRLRQEWGRLYAIARAGALWKAVAHDPEASWRTHVEPTPEQLIARMRAHAPAETSPWDRPLTAAEQAAVDRQGDYIAWQTATDHRLGQKALGHDGRQSGRESDRKTSEPGSGEV